MQLQDERSYLNTFLVWGMRQHDPARTDHIKSVNPMYDRIVYIDKIYPKAPTSRFLSPNPSTYLT